MPAGTLPHHQISRGTGDLTMGIKSSVGAKKENGNVSENRLYDLFYIRALLNFYILFDPLFKREKFFQPLSTAIRGDMGETVRAIMTFQMHYLKSPRPSGRIDPRDATIRLLEAANVPGMPKVENLAPIEDRIHNRLLRAYESDYLDMFDGNREIKCMIDMLLYNKDVDDAYLRNRYLDGDRVAVDPRMVDYIAKAAPTTPPRAIDFTVSVRGRIKAHGLGHRSTDGFVRFIVGIADEIRTGYNAFIITSGQHALSLSESANGPFAAYKNVEDWYEKRFSDGNSIYSCFPSIRNDTKPVETIWEWATR
jgi:hypothetical protein